MNNNFNEYDKYRQRCIYKMYSYISLKKIDN